MLHSYTARLAQSVEHGTLNPRVVGSSPTLGEFFLAALNKKSFFHKMFFHYVFYFCFFVWVICDH